MHLYRHLTADPRYDAEMQTMAGAVRFAAGCETDSERDLLGEGDAGDLEVLVGTPRTVTDAYKEAIAKNENDWFALHSSRSQLQLLNELGFNPDRVQAGIAVFDRALAKLRGRRMIGSRGRSSCSAAIWSMPRVVRPPRFPADKEEVAAQKIAEALDALGAGPEDLALCQAAAGGDLLFLEACQERGVRCQILLPFREPEFIERSILPSAQAGTWRERYFKMKERLQIPIRIMPDELGPLPSGVDPFERCNLWLLYTTLAWGIRQGAVHLPLERRRRRWPGRDRAHVQRSEGANRPGHLDRHAKVVDRLKPGPPLPEQK